MTTFLSLEPVDVLMLRGNRLFSDGHGACSMPPWPSIFAGALRSRILVDRKISFQAVESGIFSDEEARKVLGDYSNPGSFRITLVGFEAEGKVWLSAPADLVGVQGAEAVEVSFLEPMPVKGSAMRGSFPLPFVPILRQRQREKPVGGLWLSFEDLAKYLKAGAVSDLCPKPASRFWTLDPRLGIALDHEKRIAQEGMLYTTDAISLTPGTKIVVGVAGADSVVPTEGLLRLGGDGHAVTIEKTMTNFVTGVDPVGESFRVILATPGIFTEGWLPPDVEKQGERYLLRAGGFVAELLAAAVKRHEVVSGWDLVEGKPKTARRVVPIGSVYWFQQVEGSEEDRRAWSRNVLEQGWWPSETMSVEDRRRQSEGFNNVLLGNWARAAS